MSAGGDAVLAARLCAIDAGLGGLVLRGDADAVIAALRAALPKDAQVRRLPVGIGDDALLGGLDLGATLAAGRPVRQAGLLAQVDGGVLVVPMAERMSAATAGRIAGALDTGEVEGIATRFVVVALDESVEDETVPAVLAERLAFWVDATSRRSGLDSGSVAQQDTAAGAAQRAPDQTRGDASEALAATALALGIDSARAPIFALRAARAAAVLAGRDSPNEDDLLCAVRLVLAPRATRLPAVPEQQVDAPPPPAEDASGGEEQDVPDTLAPDTLADVVLEAALAALPPDMLARLAAGAGRKAARTHGTGEKCRSSQRGRPLGSRAGLPRGGARLSLIDTLRAAAPWQKVRGRDGRVRIRRADLRIRRFETRAESVTIFAVDASGSAAAARLAEAKGAVELLLAQAYVKRAQVALLAFRGGEAEVLLPPTRSLTRAKRALADLPGGGGTPLAAGLTAARLLAERARLRGRTPFIVVLTDGRANIAADGRAILALADRDAEDAARAIGRMGVGAAFIDTSARPRPEGARLALAMAARYLPLPRADAAAMHRAVAAAQA